MRKTIGEGREREEPSPPCPWVSWAGGPTAAPGLGPLTVVGAGSQRQGCDPPSGTEGAGLGWGSRPRVRGLQGRQGRMWLEQINTFWFDRQCSIAPAADIFPAQDF